MGFIKEMVSPLYSKKYSELPRRLVKKSLKTYSQSHCLVDAPLVTALNAPPCSGIIYCPVSRGHTFSSHAMLLFSLFFCNINATVVTCFYL